MRLAISGKSSQIWQRQNFWLYFRFWPDLLDFITAAVHLEYFQLKIRVFVLMLKVDTEHKQSQYCKTLYLCCILISRFWNVEILLHFILAFSRCSTSIYQAFDGQTEFSQIFNFAIFSYSRNSTKI